MKQLLSLPLLLLPLLIACARDGDLSPQTVMSNMIIANRGIRSVQFEGSATFSGYPMLPLRMDAGTSVFDGVMQDAGRQVELHVVVTGDRSPNDEISPSRIAATIIVLDSRETYLKINEIALSDDAVSDANVQLFSLLADTWWLLTAIGDTDTKKISPDPRLLRMQAETVQVENDHGIVKLDGNEAYFYDVRIDPDAYRSFYASQYGGEPDSLSVPQGTGSLWIDAQTFLLRKVRWDINVNDGTQLHIDTTFGSHQEPVMIVPPRDALPFPVSGNDLLELLSSPQNPASVDSFIITD